jgi:MFS family permease
MAIFGPLAANWALETLGWRLSYLAIGAVVLVVGGIGLLLISFDRPAADDVRTSSGARAKSGDWSALKKPLFWLMLLAFFLPAVFSGGYLFHMVSILRERGFSAAEAAQLQSLIGVAVLAGRLGSGAALDRFRAGYVGAVTFTITAAGCLALLSSNPWLAAFAALGVGLSVGAELDIMAYVMSRFFGVASFGRLYSLGYGAILLSSGISPMLVAFVAHSEGYGVALVGSAIGTAFGAALLLAVTRQNPSAIDRVTSDAASTSPAPASGAR